MTTPALAPRVVLVDDHALVAEMLCSALERTGLRCSVVTPRAAARLLDDLIELAPDLVLLDLDLGAFGDSTPLIAPLTDSGIRVVVLTGQSDRIRLGAAISQGAVRVVTKSAAFAELVVTIRAVAVSRAIAPDVHSQALLRAYSTHEAQGAASRQAFEQLTERERETLAQLADGKTVHEIATDWVVAETTVRSHVRGVLAKLGARSQLQAVVLAVQNGWIAAEPGNRAATSS